MSKIYINEVDLTTVESYVQDINDVVYVPGFSSIDPEAYGASKVNIPTLCTSIRDFESKFGSNPALFNADQAYPSFPSEAIPQTNSVADKMFLSGDADPSYIYAKELLARGIPVVYERINRISDVTSTSYDVTVANMYNFLENTAFTYTANIFTSKVTTGLSVTITNNTFVQNFNVSGEYLFTLTTVAESEGEHNIWSITSGDTTATYIEDGTGEGTLASIGITVSRTSGTGAQGDTFTVVLYMEDPAIMDKSNYNIKYITSGGYPIFEYKSGKTISNLMATLAMNRGDCIALIDHTNNPARSLVSSESVYNHAKDGTYALSGIVTSYAAMFTPWCEYSLLNTYKGLTSQIVSLPPSFAYLSCLAESLKNNPAWMAIAGAIRGKLLNLYSVDSDYVITNAIADSYTPDTAIAINPITNIRPYGQCIWGNRTLVDNSVKGGTTALSFLNIRNIVCDIKKQLFVACQSLLFEQNTDILWMNFIALMSPTLDRMVSGYGISNYKIVRVDPSDKTKITAIIRIYPVYAVESFDITLYLENGDVTVQE